MEHLDIAKNLRALTFPILLQRLGLQPLKIALALQVSAFPTPSR